MKINITEYTNKFNSVYRHKAGVLISTTIQVDLLEEAWKTRLEEIEGASNFEDIRGYNLYSNLIIKLFGDLCTSIMAPGVDRLISWMAQDLQPKDAAKLKNNFVKSFSALSDDIAIILDSLPKLPDKNNSIFQRHCEQIESKLKTQCKQLIAESDSFETIAKPVLEEIGLVLREYSSIKELKFSNINQFSKTETDDYYKPFIELIVNKAQSKLHVANLDDEEHQIIDSLHDLINDIKDSISLLYSSKVSEYEEVFLKQLFIHKKGDIFKEEDTFTSYLEEFLTNKWAKIVRKYRNIAQHINSPEEIKKLSDDRKSFSLYYKINKAIDYYQLLKDPSEFQALNAKSNEIEDKIESLDSSIRDMKNQNSALMQSIKKVYKQHHTSYQVNLQTLENLAGSCDSKDLAPKIEMLKEHLEGLSCIINGIVEETNLVDYVSNNIEDDLNNYTNIQTLFDEALKLTGLGEQLNWLEQKMGEEKEKELQVEDLSGLELIKDLLSRKLIKLTIKKQFQ